MSSPKYIPCRCYTPYHFIKFESDPDMPEEIDVSFVSTRPGSFWGRVKWAWLHVFGSQDLIHADVMISRKVLEDALRDV